MNIQNVKATKKGTFLVTIDGATTEMNGDEGGLPEWFIAGNSPEPAETPFEKRHSGSLMETVSQARRARQILLKNISVERALYVATKAVFAGAIGIESVATDDIDTLLAPIPDIGRLIFAIEASVSKKTPEDRRQRSLELFSGSVMAGSFVEGLEQRAFDLVSVATTEAKLDAALADIQIAQGLAICGVSLVQVNDTSKITTDILPAYAKLNSGDIVGAGQDLQSLMSGGLGATAIAVAQALIAELEG